MRAAFRLCYMPVTKTALSLQFRFRYGAHATASACVWRRRGAFSQQRGRSLNSVALNSVLARLPVPNSLPPFQRVVLVQVHQRHRDPLWLLTPPSVFARRPRCPDAFAVGGDLRGRWCVLGGPAFMAAAGAAAVAARAAWHSGRCTLDQRTRKERVSLTPDDAFS